MYIVWYDYHFWFPVSCTFYDTTTTFGFQCHSLITHVRYTFTFNFKQWIYTFLSIMHSYLLLVIIHVVTLLGSYSRIVLLHNSLLPVSLSVMIISNDQYLILITLKYYSNMRKSCMFSISMLIHSWQLSVDSLNFKISFLEKKYKM